MSSMERLQNRFYIIICFFSLFISSCDGILKNSTTDGYIWSQPKKIFTYLYSQSIDTSTDDYGNIFVAGHGFAKRYLDNFGWYIDEESQINSIGATENFDYPKTIQNNRGDICVIWTEIGSGRIFSNNFDSTGRWNDFVATDLNTNYYSYGVGFLPYHHDISIDMDEDGRVVAIWEEGTALNSGTASIHAVYFAPGIGWTKYQIPGSELGDINSPKVYFQTNGNAIAFWLVSSSNGSSISIYQSLFSDQSGWSVATQVSSIDVSGGDQRLESGKDKNGNIIVVFRFPKEFWMLSYSETSGWNSPEQIYGTSESLEYYYWQFKLNRNGEGCLVWLQDRTITVNSCDIIAMTYNVAQGWREACPIDTTFYPVSLPYVEVDQAGDIMAVWRQTDDDIQRHFLYGSYLPKGGTWQTPQRINKDMVNQISNCRIQADQRGRFTVVWEQFDGSPGSQYSCWINRFE